jgi:hypothetical protein
MYWPSTLVTVQLFTTLHDKQSSVTRLRMKLFTVVGTIAFFYQVDLDARGVVGVRVGALQLTHLVTFLHQFLPTVFFTTLTSIATLCLIDNQSWVLRTLGSGYNGCGWFNFSLDWSAIGTSAPLYTPFWAILNYFGGLCGMMWVVVPMMLLTNFWFVLPATCDLTAGNAADVRNLRWGSDRNARDFPSPISAQLFTSNYTKFDVTAVLNDDLSLNEQAWEASRPLLLTPYLCVRSFLWSMHLKLTRRVGAVPYPTPSPSPPSHPFLSTYGSGIDRKYSSVCAAVPPQRSVAVG